MHILTRIGFYHDTGRRDLPRSEFYAKSTDYYRRHARSLQQSEELSIGVSAMPHRNDVDVFLAVIDSIDNTINSNSNTP